MVIDHLAVKKDILQEVPAGRIIIEFFPVNRQQSNRHELFFDVVKHLQVLFIEHLLNPLLCFIKALDHVQKLSQFKHSKARITQIVLAHACHKLL